MKATITAFTVVLGVAACTAATETRQEPAVLRRPMPEVVLTGCVAQGSSATVLIFDNARKDPNSAIEKGERYLLVPAAPDNTLSNHLNHAVRITGEIDMRVSAMPVREPAPSDPQRPADERTLPRLIVKSVTMISDKCPTVR